MATYNLKFNKDDSVIRHIVVGLLADLNSKLSFFRQISNDERVVVDVPFFYAVSGDENFLKDNFNLTPRGIREMLKLNNPIYEITSAYGHFGRKPSNKGEFSWEKTDKANLFKL